MENIELLEDNKTQNNQWEISSDIFDNFSKKIDVQKLIDDWILQISDDVKKYIDSIWYSIEEVLNLARVSNSLAEIDSVKVKFDHTWSNWINVSVKWLHYSIDTTICPNMLNIVNNKINMFLSKYSGFNAAYSQIITAKKMWYKYITGSAVRTKQLSWYHYWPRIWFRADPDINISDLVIKTDNIQINDCKTLNELFDLKDDTWVYIGLNFWEQYGDWFSIKFNLSDGSKSIKRLNEYILSKKQSNPEKYNDIDLIA